MALTKTCDVYGTKYPAETYEITFVIQRKGKPATPDECKVITVDLSAKARRRLGVAISKALTPPKRRKETE